MVHWKRVKSATEWGFFFGIVTWLLATGITNDIPAIGIWGIILSRTLMGFIIGYIRWEYAWWARGLIIGGALNIVLSVIVKIPLGDFIQSVGFGWIRGFWMMLITGMAFGVLTELALRHREAQLRAEQSEP